MQENIGAAIVRGNKSESFFFAEEFYNASFHFCNNPFQGLKIK